MGNKGQNRPPSRKFTMYIPSLLPCYVRRSSPALDYTPTDRHYIWYPSESSPKKCRSSKYQPLCRSRASTWQLYVFLYTSLNGLHFNQKSNNINMTSTDARTNAQYSHFRIHNALHYTYRRRSPDWQHLPGPQNFAMANWTTGMGFLFSNLSFFIKNTRYHTADNQR